MLNIFFSSYFVDNAKPWICQHCNNQCKKCFGPLPIQCSTCNNFHLWIILKQNSFLTNNNSKSIESDYDEFDENEFVTTTTKEQLADGSWTVGAIKKCKIKFYYPNLYFLL